MRKTSDVPPARTNGSAGVTTRSGVPSCHAVGEAGGDGRSGRLAFERARVDPSLNHA